MSAHLREGCIRAYVALAARARSSEGQTAAEYVGVLLVVSVIVAAVAKTGVGHDITDRLSDLVRDISSGNSGQGR
jgi:hypothetical protein